MNASPIVLTREQVRQIDQIAVERYQIPSIVLMENAGRQTADVLDRLGIAGPVVLACGKGNNAGDAFVVARHLLVRGFEPRVLLWFESTELAGDAAVNYRILERLEAPLEYVGQTPATEIAKRLAGAAWIVDGLLGTGARGEPRLPLDMAIDAINASGRPVLALDIPSGLDCDTGQPASRTIRAAHTCTFVAAKPGLLADAASPFVGQLHVLDIGVPRGRNNWGLRDAK